VWLEDSSLALAGVDEPQVLPFLPTAISQGALGSTSLRICRSVVTGDYVWASNENRHAAARDSTQLRFIKLNWFASTSAFNRCRRYLSLRRAHKERLTMFAARSRAGEMLATQGTAGDAAVGEVED
jgi:hypothetical protein